MSRSTIFANIKRHDTGVATGSWAGFELQTAFQPIFAFHDQKLVMKAFEGLVRPFRDEEEISPMQFFALIPPQERLAIEALTRTIHLLNAGRFLDPATLIFVNFDPSVFRDRRVIASLLRGMRLVLHEAGIEPARVVCEVTEKKATSKLALATFVAAMRDDGFTIAVDDYGAEESDLARVRALKPDIVKFDAQWIMRLMDTPHGVALLAAMVEEFASSGIRIVFEGIEEPWQLEIAEQAGAHMVQGYALARPELAPSSFAMALGRPVLPPGSVPADAGARRSAARTQSVSKIFGRRPQP